MGLPISPKPWGPKHPSTQANHRCTMATATTPKLGGHTRLGELGACHCLQAAAEDHTLMAITWRRWPGPVLQAYGVGPAVGVVPACITACLVVQSSLRLPFLSLPQFGAHVTPLAFIWHS